ncbi:MAG: HAD hydrolase-like protein [Bacteroidota bacterium]
MKKIKGVIFDIDGTLADSVPLVVTSFQRALGPYLKQPVSDQQIMDTFGPTEEATIRTFAPAYVEESLRKFHTHYRKLHPSMCPKTFRGIIPLLHQLQSRKIKLAIVTGKGLKSALITLAQLRIDKYFDYVETGSPAEPIKEISLATVLKKWKGIKKKEVLYVGDAPGDVKASLLMGVVAVLAKWAPEYQPPKPLRHQPDYTFTSVKDFSTWLIKNS